MRFACINIYINSNTPGKGLTTKSFTAEQLENGLEEKTKEPKFMYSKQQIAINAFWDLIFYIINKQSILTQITVRVGSLNMWVKQSIRRYYKSIINNEVFKAFLATL